MQTTTELLEIIELEQQSERVFVGKSRFMGSPNIFGGQVVAQALNAATRTVTKERVCHSLHCYFVLPGNLKLPVSYEVAAVRDGGSFTTRFVTAKQNDVPIFVMAASFQGEEVGVAHQVTMPQVPAPETLSGWIDLSFMEDAHEQARMSLFVNAERPLEMRSCFQPDYSDSAQLQNKSQVWFRFKDVPENISLPHIQQLIAYASDYNILGTALLAHGNKYNYINTQMASLDHAIWFHKPVTDLTDWLLFDMVSPAAAGARGFASGHIFSRAGELVATVAQEGLLRPMTLREPVHSNNAQTVARAEK
ncbi:acyl-CoA thioesterase-2 [Flexibacter flexilis DSM 6793]|uniref:Acyl-CoA thioesterase 2 n=1 Tax=Flexibacter flexilis DSM 6793 TaxID=927664 RepID=A0A1I1IX74_9BACT|nr:acyl-CoA thioesterase II [Flexibacter flexilis]SFC40949.1 acyl-CoA thioesterase-2 [Flexibacter flexilis DSM 6793]